MAPILLVRNDAFETFGVAPAAFAEVGTQTRIWDAIDDEPAPQLGDVSGIVVFGSSYNVEHAEEHPFIDRAAAMSLEAVSRGLPVLGVCFGAQLLAWALGGEVRKAPVREIGFEPIRPSAGAATDPVLSIYDDGDHVFQWHMDTYELPDGAELLVTGDRVTNQAFRMDGPAWGVQFHLEIDAEEIELWLQEFSEEGDLKESWGKTPEDVRKEAKRFMRAHERKGAEVFRRFAALAEGRDP